MTYNQLMAAAEAHSLGQLLKCIQKKVCSNQHTGLGQMSYLLLYHKIFFSSLLVPYYKIENILQYITKVLWLSAFFSNFLKISFGGQFLNFWWFEQSRFIVVFIFLSLSACCQSVSCHCQQKNFCLYFSDATLLAALFQKRCEIC